jgi:hypothetical protein
LPGQLQHAGRMSDFKLCSPANGDHFEVSQPLLFWESSVGAKQYEVFIDDAKAGVVVAGPVPVMHLTPPAALSAGEHHWHVKAAMAHGESLITSNFVFMIETSTN